METATLTGVGRGQSSVSMPDPTVIVGTADVRLELHDPTLFISPPTRVTCPP